MWFFKCVLFFVLFTIIEQVFGSPWHHFNGAEDGSGLTKNAQRNEDDIILDCILTLNKDFGQPSPIYIQNEDYLMPDANHKKGDITIQSSRTILVACPGDNKYLVIGNDTKEEKQTLQFAEARCVHDRVFAVGSWAGHFKEIRCNAPPWISTEQAQRCHGNNHVYKVGYKIKNHLYTVYEACFDKDKLSTLWVRHSLAPASKFLQSNGKGRPQFVEGNMYSGIRMSEAYKSKNQMKRFKEVLGEGADVEYITKSQFLTKGHLAPRADFPLSGQQRASFHYINASPQWMRGNAGDWAALEEALRRRVHKLNSTLLVYTGTQHVLTLPNKDGHMTAVYLGADSNNNNLVPVPLYFYKLVYDPIEQTALGFVMINTSTYNATQIDELTFCEDVCVGARYSWLRWRNDGFHSFCCPYEELLSVVDTVPQLKVTGLFY